jgi:hypothetical protein
MKNPNDKTESYVGKILNFNLPPKIKATAKQLLRS